MRFTREEYVSRWDKVHLEMERRGFEIAVIWQRSGGSFDRAGNVLWLTDYSSPSSGQEQPFLGGFGAAFSALIMRLGYEPELHVAENLDGIPDGAVAAGEMFQHDNLAKGVALRVLALGRTQRICSVGDDTLPSDGYRMLIEAAPDIEWVPCENLLTRPQLIKSPAELDAYRIAGDIASRALTELMEALIAGEPESEAAARAAGVIMRAGGGFQRICTHHGPLSRKQMWSDPFYSFSTESPTPGDLLRGWVYGPLHKGYWIDPGRTAVCGNNPTLAQKRVIENCIMVVEAVMQATKPGATAGEVGLIGDAAARQAGWFDNEQGIGLWPVYGHGTGSFWQPPITVSGEMATLIDPELNLRDEPYKPGMVISSEFFLTDSEAGTATFEQNFIVTENGQELLTTTPTIWW